MVRRQVRTPPGERHWAAMRASAAASLVCRRIIAARLAAAGPFVAGPRTALADTVRGTLVHRWFAAEAGGRPDFPALRRCRDALHARPGLRQRTGIEPT